MKPSRRLLTLLFAPLLLSACANGYKQFYRPNMNASPETIAAMRVAPPSGNPKVERAQPGNADAILEAYAKRGYFIIGNSIFNSGRNESEEAAIRQGQDVGADLVLILNPKYTGTVTSSVPFTTPTTNTSYSSGTATAYGPGGTVNAYGSSTTTTYGTSTTYIPITVNRRDYGAVYFIKQKFSLGAFLRDLTDAERQERQTNKGAVIRIVADGTPAFDADLLVGDMVTAIDGVSVVGAQGAYELLKERQGKEVKLSLVRKGQQVEKTVQLNP